MRTALFFSLLFYASWGWAQSWQKYPRHIAIGLMGGADISGSGIVMPNEDRMSKPINYLNAGIFIDVPINRYLVLTGTACYNRYGFLHRFIYYDKPFGDTVLTQRYRYIDQDFLLRFRLEGNSIFIGNELGYLISSTQEKQKGSYAQTTDQSSSFVRWRHSFVIGAERDLAPYLSVYFSYKTQSRWDLAKVQDIPGFDSEGRNVIRAAQLGLKLKIIR